MRHHMGRLGCFLALVCFAMGSPSRATQYYSEDFGAVWVFTHATAGTGGTTDVQILPGGNPGEFLTTQTIVNGGCSVVYLFGFNLDAVYDPGIDGPLTQLDYSEDARLVDGFGEGQAIGPALLQDGKVFRGPASATGEEKKWFPFVLLGLQASQFQEIIGGGECGTDVNPGSHPDFSANGGPITFGFSRANSQIEEQGPYSITAGIDNWSVSVNGFTYVAMGDSFSSGEGLYPYIDGWPDPPRNVCHRSRDAYGFHIRYPGVRLGVEEFLACSGSLSESVRSGGPSPAAAPDLPAQLDRYYLPPRDDIHVVNASTDMITLSIGGNDAGFVPILQICAVAPDCSSDTFRPFVLAGENRSLKQIVESKLGIVGTSLIATYQNIRSQAPDASVFVLGYPREFGPGAVCLDPSVAGLWLEFERKWLDSLGDKVNATVRTAANIAGVHFVDVSIRFDDHGICSPSPWINGWTRFTHEPASFHPKAAGQRAYAAVLRNYMSTWKNLGLPLSPDGIPANPGSFFAPSPVTAGLRQPSDVLPSFGSLVVTPSATPACNPHGAFVPGQVVVVSGGGFAANAVVTLGVTADAYQSGVTSFTADDGGQLTALFTIPNGAPTNADVLIEARGVGAATEPRLAVQLLHLSTSFTSDADFDFVPDPCDTCQGIFSPIPFDMDEDGIDDACDPCPFDAENDLDGDGLCTADDPCPWDRGNDADADLACEWQDNCPLVENPAQTDADGDGVGDACDPAPADPGAFALPAEVRELFFIDKLTLSWISPAPTSGASTVHDVARGTLNALPVGSGTCLIGGVSDEWTTDSDVPAPGQGFWYVVRGRNSIGAGTYGQQSSGAERETAACP